MAEEKAELAQEATDASKTIADGHGPPVKSEKGIYLELSIL